MADTARTTTHVTTRQVLIAVATVLVLVALVVVRGPVTLLAAASVAVIVGVVLAVPPLLKDDGIDWDWLPDRGDEVPPEPGIATLRRLLSPTGSDTAAPGQLHDLVRAIAEDRSQGRGLGDGPLTAYLDGPPRRVDLREVESLITALEALPTRSPQ